MDFSSSIFIIHLFRVFHFICYTDIILFQLNFILGWISRKACKFFQILFNSFYECLNKEILKGKGKPYSICDICCVLLIKFTQKLF